MAPTNSPSDDRPSFRDRLSQIPDIEQRDPPTNPLNPGEVDWESAAPPVVRRQAPIARPAAAAQEMPVAQTPSPDLGQAGQVTGAQQPSGADGQFVAVRTKRRRWPAVLGVLLIIGALLVVVPLFIARRTFDSVPRVPVAESLTAPAPEATARNILLVGTDSVSYTHLTLPTIYSV